MAKTVTITDGVGTTELINGSFNITADVPGYDNSAIMPSQITVNASTNTYAFTISATGALTLHVTDDGTSTGNPIVGATFIRTDETGAEYGTSITTDTNGDAIFNNVPFDATAAPIIYYKQTSSDGDHEFDTSVLNTTMTSDASTVQIQNATGATRTINLTDANYENLPLSGTLTMSNE